MSASHRLRNYLFTPEALIALCMENPRRSFRTTEGIPQDAEVRNTCFDESMHVIVICVSHESFPEVKEGRLIPTGKVVFSRNEQ